MEKDITKSTDYLNDRAKTLLGIIVDQCGVTDKLLISVISIEIKNLISTTLVEAMNMNSNLLNEIKFNLKNPVK